MSLDLAPILSQLSIETKAQGVIPFQPNWAQREVIRKVEENYSAGRPTRLIVLKARQVGISTVTEAIMFAWCVLFASTNAVVMAHDGESTEYLFAKARLFHETFPLADLFPTRYSSKRQLALYTNRSQIQVVTASGRGGGGRGRTIHCLHASEFGFWVRPQESWTAVAQTVPETPSSLIVIESTANGVGNLFETMWNEAQDGATDYTPMFFPWHRHYECIPCRGLGCETATCETCAQAAQGVSARDTSERDLLKLDGMTPAHIAWRRWAIANKTFGSEELFRQEYPATPEEAFLASGVNAFPEPHIKQCFEPTPPRRGKLVRDDRSVGAVRFVEDARGPLKVYRFPSKDLRFGQYFVGADPCYGVKQGDLAAAQVIRRPQDGYPAEQVAVYHAKLNPIVFADEIAKLAAWYNRAEVAVEVEGPGQATIARLSVIYPNLWKQSYADKPSGRNQSEVQLGWSTNWRRKAWLVTRLGDYLESAKVVLHDRATYTELRTYTFLGDSEYARFQPASADQNDDLVMALGICLLCESTLPPIDAADGPSTPRMGPPELVWARQEDDGEVWG